MCSFVIWHMDCFFNGRQLRKRDKRFTMDMAAPELSKAWIADKEGAKADALRAAAEEDAGGLSAALEALANLVTAARSIV